MGKYAIDIPEEYYLEEKNKNLSRHGVTRSCSKVNIIGFFERLYSSGLRFVLYVNNIVVSEIANYNDAYSEYNALCRKF